MSKQKIWILTREHNDYDQHGEYFVKAFSKKPDVTTIAGILRTEGYSYVLHDVMAALEIVQHILDGGGRKNKEDTWYNLEQVELD